MPVEMMDISELKARFPKGARVELHPATDDWMRGDRYGEVTGYGRAREYIGPSNTHYRQRPVLVKLDKSGKTKRFSPHNIYAVHEAQKNPRKRRKNPVENRAHASKAIMTKVLSETNVRGRRVKAYDSDNNSVTLPWDYDDHYSNHVRAAEALQKKMNWGGTLVGGATKDGYVFTFRQGTTFDPRDRKQNPRKRKMTSGEARQFFDKMYAKDQAAAEAYARTPEGKAATLAHNERVLAALRAKRKKNPDAFVIACYSKGGHRLTYDAPTNRFTDNSPPSLYRTQIAAQDKAETLLKRAPKLRDYKLRVEAASTREAGPVFGARRRVNPRPKK